MNERARPTREDPTEKEASQIKKGEAGAHLWPIFDQGGRSGGQVDRGRRQALANWLAKRHRNRQMQSLLTALPVRSLEATVQRDNGDEQVAEDETVAEIEEIIAEPGAPGLTVAVARRVREFMEEGERQQALDELVQHLGETGDIDRDLLHNRQMYYSPRTGGEGVALTPGYERDEESGEWRAQPTVVRIGPAAFSRDLTWLYTSVMHEYQHVLQFQERGARGTTGQRGLDWLVIRQEVEAYAQEIINSTRTGLYWNPGQMRETWGRLHNDHWLRLGVSSRNLLNDMYTEAHRIAQEAVGEDVELPFQPASAE